MKHGCSGFVLLGVIVLCVSLTIVETGWNPSKPLGPKMCEFQCHHLIGCSLYVYMTSDLSCHLNKEQPHVFGKGIYQFHTTMAKHWKSPDERCAVNSTIFCSRGHGRKCRPRKICKHCGQRQRKKGKMTRLLIQPSNSEGGILNLHDNNMVKFPYFSNSWIYALAYTKAYEKLVIAGVSPNNLCFVSLNNGSKINIETRLRIVGLTVDDINKLVFMTSFHPKPGVSMMKIQNRKIKLLVEVKRKAIRGVASDPKRSIIIVAFLEESIKIYNYKGTFEGETVKGNIRDTLCLDLEGNFLYYLQGTPATVFKMSMDDHTITRVAHLRFDANHFCCYGNNLYVLPLQFSGDIVEVTGKGNIRRIKTSLTSASFPRVCAVD